MKKNILITTPDTQIFEGEEYIILRNNIINYLIIGFRHIKALYICKTVEWKISDCYQLAKKIPVYIIDESGNILADMQKSDENI